MKVLHVAAEVYPLVKTGGLADVVAALPPALAEAGADVRLLLPDVQVGRGVRLTKVVIDRGCKVPDGMVIGEDPIEDARRFHRSEQGVTLVTNKMLRALET